MTTLAFRTFIAKSELTVSFTLETTLVANIFLTWVTNHPDTMLHEYKVFLAVRANSLGKVPGYLVPWILLSFNEYIFALGHKLVDYLTSSCCTAFLHLFRLLLLDTTSALLYNTSSTLLVRFLLLFNCLHRLSSFYKTAPSVVVIYLWGFPLNCYETSSTCLGLGRLLYLFLFLFLMIFPDIRGILLILWISSHFLWVFLFIFPFPFIHIKRADFFGFSLLDFKNFHFRGFIFILFMFQVFNFDLYFFLNHIKFLFRCFVSVFTSKNLLWSDFFLGQYLIGFSCIPSKEFNESLRP